MLSLLFEHPVKNKIIGKISNFFFIAIIINKTIKKATEFILQ